MPTEQSPAPAQVPSAPVGYEDKIAQARAKAVTASNVKPEPAKAQEPAPTEPTPPTDPSLRRLAQLTRQNKDAADKIKAYEAKEKSQAQDAPDAALLRDVLALYKSGKKVDAIAKLAGNQNATEEMQNLLADYLGAPTGQDPADPSKTAPNPLEAKLEELQARLDSADKDKAAQAETARLEAAHAGAGKFLDEAKDDQGQPLYELCSREANRSEAYDLAMSGAAILAEAEGFPQDEPIPAEDVKRLMLLAYAEVEKEFEAYGQRFSKGQPATGAAGAKPQEPDRASPANSRPGSEQAAASKAPEQTPSRRVPRIDQHFRASIQTPTTEVSPGHRHPDEARKRILEGYRTGQ